MSAPNLNLERVNKESKEARALADELLEGAKLQELHTLCRRMIDEREKLANGFNAVVQGWSMLDDKRSGPDSDSIAAIERVATEAIQFAREVVQALTHREAK